MEGVLYNTGYTQISASAASGSYESYGGEGFNVDITDEEGNIIDSQFVEHNGDLDGAVKSATDRVIADQANAASGSQGDAGGDGCAPDCKYNFKKGEKYDIKIVVTTFVGFGAGILSVSWGKIEITYQEETIVSQGITTGGSIGSDILSAYSSNSITFHADMRGNSLLEVFNQTGMTNQRAVAGMVKFGDITGFDNANKMNKLWEANLFGAGLQAGTSSERSTSKFKEKTN